MIGGKWHAPLYTPYALYSTIDYLYGLPALERHDGFTGAQGWLNVIETLLYLTYLYMIYSAGRTDGAATGVKAVFAKRKVLGREGGLACLVGFAAAVMTLSKTVLYCAYKPCFRTLYSDLIPGLVLHCAGWEDLKHNDWSTIFYLWIIPK
jgi:hypothetical protein